MTAQEAECDARVPGGIERFRESTGWIGSARAFLRALGELAQFALADVPVLIIGETGTGKELAARAIHYLGTRRDGPFVPVNCGALPDRLFENELFGHSRGAYTGAGETTNGLIGHAEGGTLLLDEVDCLDRHSQTALLRFLQDKRYRPLGAGQDRIADVRIVASSNAGLAGLADEGHFRRDVLFRLDVARVELPPLRNRREDIPALAQHFLELGAKRFSRPCPALSPRALDQLVAHDWPGNIRELENVILRMILLANGRETIDWFTPARSGDSGSETRPASPPPPPMTATLKEARSRCLAEFERDYLISLLRQSKGSVTAASRHAETERRHLGRMIKRHGIDAAAFRA